MNWLIGAYPWIKAFHIICIVAWMAGLLYLPRLFVYHAGVASGSEASETFKVMERRLLKGITTPAMIGAVVFGGLLLATPGIVDWSRGWIHAKLGLVLGLLVFHHMLARWQKKFSRDGNRRSPNFFRMVNEIPTILMIAVILLVVVKPF